MTIGVAPLREIAFRNNDIDILPGDNFYLFSDGFSDQFGEITNKKLKHKYFKKLLESLASLPMDEQKTELENAFLEWKGSVPQVDDVLIFGFQF
jgi:serine phosphatase RsbU (regulator of sigma subunit)